MDQALTVAAIGVGGTVIVGVAALVANVRNTNKTTEVSRRAVEVSKHAVEAAQRTVELTEQGQATDRYTKAIEQLGSDKIDVRIGGIYALERIAGDSPRDRHTIVEVLSAFVRDHSRAQSPPAERGAGPPEGWTPPDVQAAATVIGRRSIRDDSKSINLAAANLTHADLTHAVLTHAVLTFADLAYANLTCAQLDGADLTHAHVVGAELSDAHLKGADLRSADLTRAQLNNADLTHADLTFADLTDAGLTGARLKDADLTGAQFDRAHLTGADLRSAHLHGAHPHGADLDGADLDGADLDGAFWPPDRAAPKDWQLDTRSGRLMRSQPDKGGAVAE